MNGFTRTLARRRTSILGGKLQINVPKHILEDLRDTFDHFDPNNTGYISISHFHTIVQIFTMRGANRMQIEKEVNETIEAKKASWYDVLNLVTKLYRYGAFEDEAKDLFRVFDKKDRGIVGINDIKNTLENELQVPASDQDISDLIEMLGSHDTNGKISFDDFRYYFNNIN